jgi:hypothetical protein
MLIMHLRTWENVMRLLDFNRNLRSLPVAVITLSILASGCSGGNGTSGVPATSQQSAIAKHAGKRTRVEAHVALTTTVPFAERAAHQRKIQPHETEIAEEALQVGHAYPNRESWGYSDLDPSCGSLTWTYNNAIPGVTVTMDPTATSLDGSSEVSFSMIPPGTPTGVYHETVTAACTATDPTGTVPGSTDYTIAVVTMDVGLIPQIPAAPTIESNMTFSPVVGQFIELKAVAAPDVTLRKNVWKPIPGNIIGSYTETTAMASPKPFDAADLKKQVIDFYWIQDTKGSPVDIRVDAVFPVKAIHCGATCTGAEDEWGATDAESKANVVAPTGVSLTSQTGQVLVGLDPSLGCIPSLHFGFYGTDTCPSTPSGPNGIRWTFRATAPKGGAGDLDATQLIQRTDARTALPGAGSNPSPPVGTRGQPALDQCLRYGTDQDTHQPIGDSASATYTSADSPDLPLSPEWKTLTDTDEFSLYFVYKPADESGLSQASSRQNIWIPLGLLHWNWEGAATNKGTRANTNWKLSSSSYAHNPSGVAGYTPLPTWLGFFNAVKTTCPPGG